LSEIQRVDVAS